MIDRTSETKTLAAWTKAAQRALAADLPHQLTKRGGAVLVPSLSRDGARHYVKLEGGRVGACDCEAGLLGRPCKHRAAVAIRLFEHQTGVRVQWLKAMSAAMVARYLADLGAATVATTQSMARAA